MTLVLPVLKKLVYQCDDNVSSDEGFLLFPPSLEELSISALEGDIIVHIFNMCNQSASSLPLKSLKILENHMEECFDGDLAHLQMLPNLEVLETAFPSERDIDSLAVSKGDEIPVPRLKDLHLNITLMTSTTCVAPYTNWSPRAANLLRRSKDSAAKDP